MACPAQSLPFYDNALVQPARPPSPWPPALKLAVFDFDCTLTVSHVFSSLAGDMFTPTPVPPPHARTEMGQLSRLLELDAHPDWGPGGFALKAFGGAERVGQIQKLLTELHEAGAECVVCSRGMLGPLRKCLDEMHLLSFFSQTFGSLGASLGATDYDLALPAEGSLGAQESYLGTPEMHVGVSKAEVIKRLIQERGLGHAQVVLVDDDIDEINRVRGICATIHINHGKGLSDLESNALRRMSNGGNHESAASTSVPSTSPTSTSPPSSFSSEDRQGKLDRIMAKIHEHERMREHVGSTSTSRPTACERSRVVLRPS